MPLDTLEAISHLNWNTPGPRPVDPAVLFDLVKCRRLLEEAVALTERAAGDTAPSKMTGINGGVPMYLQQQSRTQVQNVKLSPERKFRMREQAIQKVCQAYRIDDMAASMDSMQTYSPLLGLAPLVLKRNPDDVDAKYVQFFHEKVSPDLLVSEAAEASIEEVISARPHELEALRTRADIKSLNRDYQGAADDLTKALSMCRYHRQSDARVGNGAPRQKKLPINKRPMEMLSAKNQPSGLESQLLFFRSQAYMNLSFKHVWEALPAKQSASDNSDPSQGSASKESGQSSPNKEGEEWSEKQVEAQRLVKTYAKRAHRDLMAFITPLEYSPDLPKHVLEDLGERCKLATQSNRVPRPDISNDILGQFKMYSLGDLFAPTPLEDLPPPLSQRKGLLPDNICEIATYHPYLLEALHSLLLCHCLMQTPLKELQRHAVMVARIIFITDGYPMFTVPPVRAEQDWLDVLRRIEDKLQVVKTWATLSKGSKEEASAEKFESKQKNFENKLKKADLKIDMRAEAVYRAAYLREQGISHEDDAATANQKNNKHGNGDDNPLRGYTTSERATAISLWMREAPLVTGTATKRRKRTKKGKGKAAEETLTEAMVDLYVRDPSEVNDVRTSLLGLKPVTAKKVQIEEVDESD